jgi:hypothetical protein
MKKSTNDVFLKFETVAKTVIDDLRSRGFIVPIEQDNGSLKFDNILVEKSPDNTYRVRHADNNFFYVENLNLPQTAVLIANDIALGKIIDNKLVDMDAEYGYKLFDQEVYLSAAKRKKNTLDQEIFYQTRLEISKVKKQEIKSRILRAFKKLSAIR